MSKNDMTAEAFINNHSFIENENIDIDGIRVGNGIHMHAGERVIPVECIKEMIEYYFNNNAECK